MKTRRRTAEPATGCLIVGGAVLLLMLSVGRAGEPGMFSLRRTPDEIAEDEKLYERGFQEAVRSDLYWRQQRSAWQPTADGSPYEVYQSDGSMSYYLDLRQLPPEVRRNIQAAREREFQRWLWEHGWSPVEPRRRSYHSLHGFHY